MFLKYKMLIQEHSHGTSYRIYRRRWLFWYDDLGSISINDNIMLTRLELMNRLYGLGVTDNYWIIILSDEIFYIEKIKHGCFEIINKKLINELTKRKINEPL